MSQSKRSSFLSGTSIAPGGEFMGLKKLKMELKKGTQAGNFFELRRDSLKWQLATISGSLSALIISSLNFSGFYSHIFHDGDRKN